MLPEPQDTSCPHLLIRWIYELLIELSSHGQILELATA
jgi:hypothetical protein